MKTKFGAIIVAGSGKIGGHVASKNRAGSYLRTKVTPSNPNTPAQAAARSMLSALSTNWGALTESQRLGWNGAVKDFSSTDVFGDIKNPSGINLFVKLNANLLNTEQATLLSAPKKIEVPFSPIQTVVYSIANAIGSTILFAGAQLDGEKIIISATPVVSAGTTFVKNLYRVISSAEVADQEAAYKVAYNEKFGAPKVGDKFYISVAPVVATGQKGIAQTYMVIVTA